MKSHYSLAIIGAGPAGMAAAIQAAQFDIDAIVLDQQPGPGGQIFRNLENSPVSDRSILGEDYQIGIELIAEFRGASINYMPNVSIWNIDTNADGSYELGVLVDNQTQFILIDKLIMATGAQERPMPIPGWQLPGVMTAGAGQILLKSAAMLPANGVILAGSGPLLLLLACQYLRAGLKIQGFIDTTPPDAMLRALPLLPNALQARGQLLKGLNMLVTLRQAKVPIYKHCSDLVALGSQRFEQISFRSKEKQIQLSADTLLLHQGIVPGIHFPQLAGCKLDWNKQQLSWQARCDPWGETTSDSVFLVGDGSAIVGAKAAELQGKISALQIAHQLGAIKASQRDRNAKPLKRFLCKQLSIRPFLDALYRPSMSLMRPADTTLVCRCEEITAGEIRAAARLGCRGPNQTKAFTRCGMGPCQGRLCGSSVSEIIAEVHNIEAAESGYYRARPPLSPITLGQLAKSPSIKNHPI